MRRTRFLLSSKKELFTSYWKTEEASKKRLVDTLNFRDKTKYRWAIDFTKNYKEHPAPLRPPKKISKAVKVSMKVGHKNNISLVAAVYVDISDSAKLDAKPTDRGTLLLVWPFLFRVARLFWVATNWLHK